MTSKPTPPQIQAWLPLYARKSDAFLAHLQRVLSTTSGLDSLLCMIYYGSTLAASQLDHIHRVFALSPSQSALQKQATTALQKQRLKSLSSLAGDIRSFMRLWGLLGVYRWAQGTLYHPPKDAIVKMITWTQIGVNTVMCGAENLAYLSGKGIIALEPKLLRQCHVYTAQLWFVHTMLELLKLLRKASISDPALRLTSKEKETWWKDFAVNSAYAPITVHWTKPGGLLDEQGIGGFGVVAGYFGLREAWRKTRQ